MILRTQNKLYFGREFEVLDTIPQGVWLLMFDELKKEYYLEKQADFTFPEKIYGDEEETALRPVRTFKRKNSNIGVLLTGTKGNGKTLTAKLICKYAEQPTILVTQPFLGEGFQNFLSTIQQEVSIYIDEFEKVYKKEEGHQEEFLHILDGVFQGKKLFIFTTNSPEINTFLKNRPGRIRYYKEYEGLDKKVIEEVIDDLLEDKSKKQEVIEITWLLGSTSMDVLLNLIDEMNAYGEPARVAINRLNIQVEHSEFDVLMFLNGKRFVSKIHYNPLTSKYIWIGYRDETSNGEPRFRYYEKEVEEMTIQSNNGEFIFKDLEGNELTFTPSKSFKFKI